MKRALGITLDIAWVADHNIKDFTFNNKLLVIYLSL